MQYILIILFLLILASMTVLGFNKGFVRTLVSMSAILIALAFVYFLGPKITGWIDGNTKLREKTFETISKKLEETFAEEGAQTEDEQAAAMKESWVPGFIVEKLDEGADAADLAANSYKDRMAGFLAGLIVSATGITAALLAVFIVLKVLQLVSGILNKIPMLGGINKIFGAVLGFGRGLIILWLICWVITVFAGTEIGGKLLQAIGESRLLSLFYNGALSFAGIFK